MSTRAGFVAILGLPNVGKSTLLNRLVGEPLAITSSKPQTTRRRLAGIRTDGEAQLVFVDTPGLLDPGYALQQALAREAARATDGVDLIYLVRDATATAVKPDASGMRVVLGAAEETALGAARGVSAFLVLNKTDLVEDARARQTLERAGRDPRFAEVHAVSGLTGSGLDDLLEATRPRLPEAAFFFDAEQVSDKSLRFLAAELVRETLYEELEQELPYACHVEVASYDERRPVPRIEAVIWVERDSQKGIVIGRAGDTLKRIGIRSRAKIEGLAGGQIFLHLTVKVRPNWRRKEADLRRFGYQD
jgi:GTP-binding protein Era